jgi:hypothetical protein
MSFFNSEFVRAEMKEISELQNKIYGSVFKFHSMTKDDKIYHISLLEKLLYKQQILYARMSLSDDVEAKEMKSKVVETTRMMGLDPGVDINTIFNNMTKMLEMMRKQIEETHSF